MIRRVSSSGRTCGRPRQRRSRVVSVSAMLLDDACHSIDSPYVGPILENIKFPNLAHPGQGAAAMTRHSTSFDVAQAVPAGAEVQTAVSDAARDNLAQPQVIPVKKDRFRRLLMAGTA